MTHELAKELYLAGFPMKSKDVSMSPSKITAHTTTVEINETIIPPTLSELIKACGDQFNSLERRPDGWRAVHHADPNGFNHDALIPFITCVGPTPEEAVARLWLVLNKK